MQMAEGKRRDEWDRMALLVSTIVNVNKPEGSKLLPAWKVNPFGKRPRVKPAYTITDPAELAALLAGGKR